VDRINYYRAWCACTVPAINSIEGSCSMVGKRGGDNDADLHRAVDPVH
jgi:hypothetical protein